MKKIENQQANIKTLINLINENHELEIVPMVNYEVCASDDYCSWLGSWGEAKVDEYWCDEERIYFRSEDAEQLIEDAMDNGDWDENMTDEEVAKASEKEVAEYGWVKCICVRIETP
ncbi:hypothetical protein EXM90_19135 [Clostridium botulinum]|uniref:hypothetical protein n=1 Tax=Clostridium botulinum TaxID=1491 RepID=UPI000466C25E|nr:hypothetical protein [Clostridium botulinum]APR02399.1 hypothetical protein RSJ2_3941 [Clostridium botulinum]AUN01470.1 hypothetical protein RSJ19_00365 [Clostridium botulinum]MBN3367272.1 hypothetical protein [Clostridium botulinum]MBN3371656.1 hypothetical protein [Clostridium botulinum]MBN3375538.1 hypothetical protein [Clostridium botulinum]